MHLNLARHSLWNRRGTVVLTLITLIISVALLFGIDHIRKEAKNSFSQTISGTDLIVGARSGSINLLLYSVFRIGNPTNNITWESYQDIANHSAVAWTIPITLGDSHRGYRVIGTNQDYFEHFQYGRRQNLAFAEGREFDELFDVVLGWEVAQALGYELGTELVIAHGMGAVSFVDHGDMPFTVTGILAPTGTPVDQSLHISLEAWEAIHLGWESGMPDPRLTPDQEDVLEMDMSRLQPNELTAAFVGVRSPVQTFALQRVVNNYRSEPLQAVMPGVALSELWQMIGMIENVLLLIAFLVLIATLVGMTTSLLASMRERQREMAILRALGASPWTLVILIQMEVLLITLGGLLLGSLVLWGSLQLAQPWLISEYGLFIGTNIWNADTLAYGGLILGLALVLGLLPSLVAYRRALADGLSVKL
ncbi:ABC transporter permease [Natronospirillum operosum]|uniref:ABC transporter permease n=1 Tax=Natronospirillum operosum TaxID=2759953 RepID=A0A4Z0W6K2_9GAMM|nr:ABC transporter permease [Natronospirillum operosum]TGG91773.1 ABC transporter permease [Natronospirillum operosum]